MVDKKPMVMLDVVLVMYKIADHKLNGHNYLDWSKTIRLYLQSSDMNNHMVEDPSIDDSREQWLQEDACLFLQILA